MFFSFSVKCVSFFSPHVQRKDKSSSFTLAFCTCWLVKDLLKQDKVRRTFSLETSLVLAFPYVNLNTSTPTGRICLFVILSFLGLYGHYNL